MQVTTSTTAASTTSALGTKKSGFGAVTTGDFLNLMITQLQNQDPLNPTSNQELMQQLATIRNMDMSVTLTNSIRTLTDNQRFGAAAALIGQYVRGPEPETGERPTEGVVRSLRFTDRGQVVLELVGGQALPLQDLTEVTGLEELIGQIVDFSSTGADGTAERLVGEVTGVAVSASGEPVLEVDAGGPTPITVRLRDVVALSGGLGLETDVSGASSFV